MFCLDSRLSCPPRNFPPWMAFSLEVTTKTYNTVSPTLPTDKYISIQVYSLIQTVAKKQNIPLSISVTVPCSKYSSAV